MAIPKFEEDVEILSKLGDYPGSDNNLSTAGFKAKFDEAAIKFKHYINNVLIPNLDMIVDVQALLSGILDKSLSVADKAADAKATGDALNGKLSKGGGIMTGNINMSEKRITNVGNPAADGDAANRGYVDSRYRSVSIVLPASGWADNRQTVNVEGVTSDSAKTDVYASAGTEDQNYTAYTENGVRICAQLDGMLTFQCNEVPDLDLTVNIAVHVKGATS